MRFLISYINKMTGETKQIITNIRKEYESILNLTKADIEHESAEAFADELIKRVNQFDSFLIVLDEPIEYADVLGISIGEQQVVKDKYGGSPQPRKEVERVD